MVTDEICSDIDIVNADVIIDLCLRDRREFSFLSFLEIQEIVMYILHWMTLFFYFLFFFLMEWTFHEALTAFLVLYCTNKDIYYYFMGDLYIVPEVTGQL